MTVREIMPDEAKEKLDDGSAVFVDIRDPGSYQMGHIKGAVSLSSQESADAFLAGADKKVTVVVVCYHGHSSMGGAAFLIERGFEDVYSMTGGFEYWRNQYEWVRG